MSVPLATLRRHASTVLLDVGMASGSARMPVGSRMRMEFRSPHDAITYLRYWKGDPGAMSELRSALSKYQRALSGLPDDEVIAALAQHLARGELVIVTSELNASPPPAAGGYAGIAGTVGAVAPRPGPRPVTEAPAARAVVPPGEVPPPNTAALLEEVQIEGATVLPRLMQALEQLDATMAEVEIADVSLEATPSGVSAIDASLGSGSDSITSTLDDL